MINRGSAISLTALQEIIKNNLYNIDSYWIIAEINELKVNYNEHCYLELVEKDQNTQYVKSRISATIWASMYKMIRSYFESATGQPLKSGINVLVKVHIQYHELYGLSLNITDIEPSYTIGDIQLRKQNVINQLQQDGVFDLNKELPFPVLPQRIAIISSKTAAGYGDFMQQINNNKYKYVFQTTLFEATMQGLNAESSIISAFEKIYDNHHLFDVIIIIRGGGSQADLSCFDLYDLVYHATQLPLPFLTGIGHDKDVSVLDMVAHKMLKTPTAVADFLISHFISLEQTINFYETKLMEVSQNKIQQANNNLVELYNRVKIETNQFFYKEKMLLNSILPDKIRKSSEQLIIKQKMKLESLQVKLSACDPVNILNKGYSITLYNGKRIAADTVINENDMIETILPNKKINSVIKKIEKYGRNEL
ncbi:MAG: exodeoxyribonuclease VII large subunit [Prevotellaceae bacterium]|jgi:exodeoxyribonuclease VII large subunit|nr:exodeoxyribonuclease VII large subunit [Prevotellaceae bacterium]